MKYEEQSDNESLNGEKEEAKILEKIYEKSPA